MEEHILKTQEELNLIELYKIKKDIYNSSFKRFVNIFETIENINFGVEIKYEEIDFSTIVIIEDINDSFVQENIFFTNTFLDSTNEMLNRKLDELVEVIKICKDYSKLNKQGKEVLKDSYFFARYIQILCTTNIHETYLQSSMKLTSSIEKEVEAKIWFSIKNYLHNLLKNKFNK